MKPPIYMFCLFCLFSRLSNAQQLPAMPLLPEQGFITNPAMTAPYGYASAGGSWLKFWQKFENAPLTVSAFGQLPVLDNVSVGLSLTEDRVGYWQQFFAQSTFAYRLSLGRRNAPQLSLGAGVALLNSRFDLAATTVNHTDDPLLTADYPNHLGVQFTGGAFFSTANHRYPQQDNFYFGLAARYVLPAATEAAPPVRQRVLHANARLGFLKQFTHTGFIEMALHTEYLPTQIFMPNIWLRYAPTDFIWIGGSWRPLSYPTAFIGLRGEALNILPWELNLQVILPGRLTGGGWGYGIGVNWKWE